MSVRVMAEVWDLPDMLPTEKLVLLNLADFANDGGICWPSLETIGRKTGVSRRHVRRIIQKLEGAGLLRVDRGQGRGATSRYQIVVASYRPREEDLVVPESGPEKGDNMTPISEPEKGTPETQKGTPGTGKGDTHDPQNHQEPPEPPERRRAPPIAASEWGRVEGLNLEAWNVWLEFRRSHTGWPAYRTTTLALRMSKLTAEQQQAVIVHSIENEYQGLFPDKGAKLVQSANGPSHGTRYERDRQFLRDWLADHEAAAA